MKEHYHFIGIGGIGMSGLARMLLQQGLTVSGSDIASSYVTEGLIKAGAKVYLGHAASNVTSGATVVYSTDIKNDNPEYVEAQRMNYPIMHRSDLLFKLMLKQETLAVAGTHGKTTTSSLLSVVLTTAGLNPSFAVGGIVQQLQSNAGWGLGDYFVAEADESDGTFLKYNPFGAIITNIDLDHINYFGNEAKLIESFKLFADKIHSGSHLFWCYDDQRLRDLNLNGISYGFERGANLHIVKMVQDQWKIILDIDFKGKLYTDIEVALVGHHNALNSAAVFGLALQLNASEELVRKALATFKGVKRRCERKGNNPAFLILDDYAHHPTEIKTTLEGIRKAIGKRRLITVFQPHRYSRTQDCLGTYGGIFNAADQVIITDIYAAGETPIPSLSYKNVMDEIAQTYSCCRYIPRKDLLIELPKQIMPQDVVVTLGAGDITKFSAELAEKLK
jgi:UDP-N-acetylmuramate--alanine ligase